MSDDVHKERHMKGIVRKTGINIKKRNRNTNRRINRRKKKEKQRRNIDRQINKEKK